MIVLSDDCNDDETCHCIKNDFIKEHFYAFLAQYKLQHDLTFGHKMMLNKFISFPPKRKR